MPHPVSDMPKGCRRCWKYVDENNDATKHETEGFFFKPVICNECKESMENEDGIE